MKPTTRLMIYFFSISLLTTLFLPRFPGISAVQAAPATTLTVTKTADTNDGVCDADCSLREAVAAASSGDTIQFSVTGTITLGGSQILIDKNLTISGPGTGSLTVSGNNASRVFEIASGQTVAISGLTLVNGFSSDRGGGIYNNQGTLTVTNSFLSSNSGGFYGGGIYNDQGTLTVTNSLLSDNSANNGGGILNDYGILTVTNSTVSGNSANFNGGGICNTGTLTMTNSTISENSASYGGGIFNGNTLNYANTIIANSVSGGDCQIDEGAIGTNINTLVEDSGCSATYSGDPKLNSLSDGVHVPLSDSPAIDAGDNATCAAAPVNDLDQRGEARDDLRCDIGAVEVKLSDTDTVIKSVSGAGTFTFGPTLAQIEVTDQGTLGQIEVQHHSGNHPNATAGQMTGQWWGITPTGSGFTANLNVPHPISPDSDAQVCKHLSGSTWDCARTNSSATRVWLNGLTAFSDWAAGDSTPLSAVLAGFDAQQQGAAILVNWETVSEIGNLGFNLWRGVTPTAPDLLLNSALIPSAAPGSSQGFSYEWLDSADLVGGTTYYYWLEDVDSSGAVTRHGPTSAAFNNAPTAVRLTGAEANPPGQPLLWLALLVPIALAPHLRRRHHTH